MKLLVELRKPRIEDAIDLAQEANDPAVAAGLRDYFPSPYSVDDALRFIEVIDAKTGPQVDFVITVNGEVAGIMGLFVGEDVYRYNAELGYWVGKRFWGQGITTKAIEWTIDYAWRTLKVDRIYAEVFSSNIGSQRVLEKNGLVEEFRLANVVVKDSKRLDMICYGIKKPADR
ncbi:MAG: GNAT family N-acetyltransferase [Saprospiraceae bacterium]